MSGMSQYPSYTRARLRWLPQIPSHWEEKRAKYYFREVDERSLTGQEELLSVSHVTGVTPRKKNVTMFMAASNVGHKVCRPGDIAVNTMWAWMGAMGVSAQLGLVSPSYAVYRPRLSTLYHPEFIDQLLRTKPYTSEYLCRSTGIRTSRLRLYPEDFLDIPLVRPPLDEQELLVSYIRRQDRLISRLIRNRRQLIGVLSEQKQAIVNQTLTRGLDAGVSLKSSGIDWLGGIPKHWLVKPLKRWAAMNARVLPESTDPDYEFSYIDIGAVGTGFLLEQPARIRFGNSPSRARRILRGGDTIISTVRTYLKAVLFIRDEPNDLIASTGFAVLSPNPGVVPEALSLAVQSKAFVDIVTARSTGIGYPAIAETRLGTLHIALPPTMKEQEAIVASINQATAQLDAAITSAQREIDLIREFRIRLIVDVVTGKLDVRHLAPPPSEADQSDIEGMDLEETLDDELEGAEEGDIAEEALNADD
jgi:type I restriction enzyme S subunit